ncbi:PAP2 superfamily protein [Lacunisphaera limnophila]|uniref:PAP2 superfamily protein n=1 Tax=Lacunisphaera limnophila TaxID=1838286 RepID=A0A1D8ATD6_9BACT|nr:phosphatase PAP2 family protein [Lacunisphaera limnophila]AOS44132.1 PAP2 superfamily protein [Lacunisphaera limnophila]
MAGLLLAVFLVVAEATALDLWVQDRCYDFAQGRWMVDATEPLGRLFFYDGPKVIIILTAVVLLGLLLGPVRWRDRWGFGRRELGVAVLTLVTLPVLASVGKGTTNTFTPAEIRRYGGDVPYVKVFEAYPADDRPAKRGRAFPAGHASGGFALIGLAVLGRTRAWWWGGIALSWAAGWWMGGYQILKGAHYLSHTVTTMLLAWMVVGFWGWVLRERTAKARTSQGF